jgi:hypothetical protein
MKNWKDWALGLFMTLSGAFGMVAYNNIQASLDKLILNQDKMISQVIENTKDISLINNDLFKLHQQVKEESDYTRTKFQLYDDNISNFYRNYGYLFKRPTSVVIPRNNDTMYIDKKYYRYLNSMFDLPFNATINS